MDFTKFKVAKSYTEEELINEGVPDADLREESVEKYNINVGMIPLMTWLGVQMLATIADWPESKVMDNLDTLGLSDYVVNYLKLNKMSIGTLMENARNTLNAGVIVVSDNLPGEVKRDFDPKKMEKNQYEAAVFAAEMEHSQQMIKFNNADYIKAKGYWDSDLAYVRFDKDMKLFYDMNRYCRMVYKYSPDTTNSIVIPKFHRPKMPLAASLPPIAARKGNITLLAHYCRATFKPSFGGYFQNFPLFAMADGIPEPKTPGLIALAARVRDDLIGSVRTYPFSFAWAKIVAKSFHSDEPFPKERVFCMLARYIKASVFHGPLEDVVKWFYGNELDLINTKFIKHDGIVVRDHDPKKVMLDGAILYSFTPEVLKSYIFAGKRIAALIFPWSAVANAISDAYSSFFTVYHAASVFILFGENVCIALSYIKDDPGNIGAAQLQMMWPLMNNFILACFFDQWFKDTKCHVVRVKFHDGTIDLQPISNPAPIVRIYQVPKTDRAAAKLVPSPFKPRINLNVPSTFGDGMNKESDSWVYPKADYDTSPKYPTYAGSPLRQPYANSPGNPYQSAGSSSQSSNDDPIDINLEEVPIDNPMRNPAWLGHDSQIPKHTFKTNHMQTSEFRVTTAFGFREVAITNDNVGYLVDGNFYYPIREIYDTLLDTPIQLVKEGFLYVTPLNVRIIFK